MSPCGYGFTHYEKRSARERYRDHCEKALPDLLAKWQAFDLECRKDPQDIEAYLVTYAAFADAIKAAATPPTESEGS